MLARQFGQLLLYALPIGFVHLLDFFEGAKERGGLRGVMSARLQLGNDLQVLDNMLQTKLNMLFVERRQQRTFDQTRGSDSPTGSSASYGKRAE